MDLSDDSVSSGPSTSCLQSFESLTQSLRRETKITNITYRIQSRVNFISATRELLQFVTSDDCIFSLYQQKIIAIMQLARLKLENWGAKVFLWVSCPPELEAHKKAYTELLRMLEANQKYVDSHLNRSVRVLLMPLTSRFSRSTRGTPEPPRTVLPHPLTGCDATPGHSTCRSPEHSPPPEQYVGSLSSLMLPPNEFDETPPPRRPQSNGKRRPRLLWDPNEHHIPPRHRHRSRPPHRLRHEPTSDADTKLVLEQENVAPEPSTTEFRPAPTRQRFGIFLTGKSSMHGSLNRMERNMSRPTH